MASGGEARPHATKRTVDRRDEDILRLRSAGATFWDLRAYVRGKGGEEGGAWHLAPGIKPMSDGNLWRYIQKADKIVKAASSHRRKLLLRLYAAKLRRQVAKLHRLYYKAVQVGDYRTALAILKDEANLLGLYPGQKCRYFRRAQ